MTRDVESGQPHGAYPSRSNRAFVCGLVHIASAASALPIRRTEQMRLSKLEEIMVRGDTNGRDILAVLEAPLRTIGRIAVAAYLAQAVAGFTIGFALPWVQFFGVN